MSKSGGHYGNVHKSDGYMRPIWICDKDIDNSDRWSRPPLLEWPVDLEELSRKHAEMKAGVQIPHFAPINLLCPGPDPEVCIARIKEVLEKEPRPPNPGRLPMRPEEQVKLPPMPPAVSTVNHPFIFGWAFTRVRPDLPILDDAVVNLFYGQLPTVNVISIASTRAFHHYWTRPNVATFNWLKKILGEPTWFRYPFSGEAYDAQDGY
ncbi:hypothetical protein BN946_scf185033.g5 [Trametes cinnabarina]|uniref:Uncharacterized protein n=1 Tax=Pycnoporus cinnabarinus TaxID=5643 RepID=A0A060SWG4_PYCCI|nr:hypothetical protein BN946_scf185033.g5 [Trametes cinnabarina]